MKSKLVANLFLLICVAGFVFVQQGCKDDPIVGCTDPEAETYDANAEENDASLCVYTRDKFVGEYDGTLECMGNLTLINGMNTFSIAESSKGVTYVDVTINTATIILVLEATVSGNVLTVNQFIPGVTVAGFQYDLTATGDLDLSTDQSTLSGTLNLKLENSFSKLEDSCLMTGVRK